jgi:hypothetical protein
MKIASFSLDTKGQKQVNLDFKVEYKNDCTGKNIIYLDTLVSSPVVRSIKS